MPSRLGVALIVLFWAATLGYVGYRDVWPRLAADAAPAVVIDLADEAAQAVPTRWAIYRGDDPKPVGRLTTRMEYLAEDDTFQFVSSYGRLAVAVDVPAVGTLATTFPKLETAVRVTRAGALRAQWLAGVLEASVQTKVGAVPVGDARADVSGEVAAGQLAGRCRVWYPAAARAPAVDRPLDPVPVPAGQVLNPLTPVARLRDVRPGRRWVVRQVNPLQDALGLLAREALKGSAVAAGVVPQGAPDRDLVAEVLRAPDRLDRPRHPPADCWVIEYRGDDARARTWVAVADGRVLRQEAAGFGERLRFDRED